MHPPFFPPPSTGSTPPVGGNSQIPYQNIPLWQQILRDPRLLSHVSQSFLTAPNFHTALAGVAQVPQIQDQIRRSDEEDRQREDERKRREEQDRRGQETHELRMRQEQQRTADRNRERVEGDQERMQEREERKAYDQVLSRIETDPDMKVDPRVLQMYRNMDPEEGERLVMARFFPGEAEKLRTRQATLSLRNTEQIMADRDDRMQRRASEEEENAGASVDLNRALSYHLREAKRLEGLGYRKTQADESQLQQHLSKASELAEMIEQRGRGDGGLGGLVQMGEETAVSTLAGMPAVGGEDNARQLVSEWKEEGIYEAVIRHLQQGKDLRTAILMARKGVLMARKGE